MSIKLQLPRLHKLCKSRQFREVYNGGRRISGSRLTLLVQPNQLSHNRLGISVSKKRFRLSVQRHWVMRRLREAYRINQADFSPGHDIVITARGFALKRVNFAQLQRELLSLARIARMLK